MESTTSAAAERTGEPKVRIDSETKFDVLTLENPVEGVRDLIIELRPEKRLSANARTLKLCEPPRIEIPTRDGLICVEIKCWLNPQREARRQPTVLTLG